MESKQAHWRFVPVVLYLKAY